MGEIELGADAFGRAQGVTYEAGEALSPGDVVAIAGGQAVPANSGSDTNAIGVVAESAEDVTAGDTVTIYLRGLVVTNVAAGVAAGTELDIGTTDGQLAAGTGGFEALSDEAGAAGLGIGGDLPANGAVVKLP